MSTSVSPLKDQQPKTATSEMVTPKSLRVYLQDTLSQALTATPIVAIFLAQFDVRSGYELKWSRVTDESVPLEGVEFKSLPSGLHAVQRATVSFVQPKHPDEVHEEQLLYGVSVFHQNLEDSSDNTRANVKMFSLGILVDPSLQKLTGLTGDTSWRPIDYTKGLEYVHHLHKLLDDWDQSTSGLTLFEEFFTQHSKANLVEQLSLKSPTVPNVNTSLETSSLRHHTHHYLLRLPQFLETLGPLVFRVWKSALLRERILLFDSPSIELNCSFAYCISILSILPQDIAYLINDIEDLNEELKYLQPLYSVGVNDIDWLKKWRKDDETGPNGFVAASTDEILSYKPEIHDISVNFNASHHLHDTSVPELTIPSESSPQGTVSNSPKATQRDLKRFKILSEELGLTDKDVNQNTVDENGELKWWNDVTEPVSWKQIAWSGFYWWASAGEKSRVEFEQEYEGLSGIDSVHDEIERSLLISGYFHTMTKRIFTIIIDVLSNENSSVHSNDTDGVISIETTDLFEMGLDPYSSQDAEFIIKLVKVWFNREAKVGSSISNLCCF